MLENNFGLKFHLCVSLSSIINEKKKKSASDIIQSLDNGIKGEFWTPTATDPWLLIGDEINNGKLIKDTLSGKRVSTRAQDLEYISVWAF